MIAIPQIILIYFTGREFSKLAAKAKENRYLYGLVGGVGVYGIQKLLIVLLNSMVRESSIELLN